jgi:hypothetical protein
MSIYTNLSNIVLKVLSSIISQDKQIEECMLKRAKLKFTNNMSVNTEDPKSTKGIPEPKKEFMRSQDLRPTDISVLFLHTSNEQWEMNL